MPLSAIISLVSLRKRGRLMHIWDLIMLLNTCSSLWDFHDATGKCQGRLEHIHKEQNPPSGGFATSFFFFP